MSVYVQLKILAKGTYSGATYEDELFMTEEQFDQWEEYLPKDMYISGLDGKHSETRAVIEINRLDEDDIKAHESVFTGMLYDRIGDDLFEAGIENWQEQLAETKKAIEKLNTLASMTIRFDRKNREKIEELLKDYLI